MITLPLLVIHKNFLWAEKIISLIFQIVINFMDTF